MHLFLNTPKVLTAWRMHASSFCCCCCCMHLRSCNAAGVTELDAMPVCAATPRHVSAAVCCREAGLQRYHPDARPGSFVKDNRPRVEHPLSLINHGLGATTLGSYSYTMKRHLWSHASQVACVCMVEALRVER